MIKKFLTLFLCLCATVLSANAQTITSDSPETMYIYGVDGDVFRLPISQIDSIAFVHPTITHMEFYAKEMHIEINEALPVEDYLEITPHYAYPIGVEWFNDNTSVAQLGKENGKVYLKGIAEGSTTLIAKCGEIVTTTTIQVRPPRPLLENGLYICGPATPIADLRAENAAKGQFAMGFNESSYAARDGLYEKYIVLEANKEFELILHETENDTRYGAELTYGEELIATDYQNIAGYKGTLMENTTMKVTETGLYHIIVDFNQDGALDLVGGAQVIIVPVEWGIRGAMNGWGYTEAEDVKEENGAITYTWSDVTIETNGSFKFAHNNCWRIDVDGSWDAYWVSVHANLGKSYETPTSLSPGGLDMELSRGIWQIQLVWTLAGGEIGNSYSYTITKTADLPELDPSTFTYSFIGSVNGNWDTDTDFTFVSKQDNHYVFEATGLDFPAGEFKIRFGHDWAKSFGYGSMEISGIETSDNGGNIGLATPFKGSAKLEFDWFDGYWEGNIKLTFTEAAE